MSATVAQIDLHALTNNLAEVRRLVGDGVVVLAVVKANAYGHGAPIVARALARAGTTHFGVTTVGEGVELRQAGIDGKIVILGGIWEEDVSALLKEELTAVIGDLNTAAMLSDRAMASGRIAPVHLKVDTGMTRLGVPPEGASSLARRILELPGAKLEGLLTHFSNAESVTTPETRKQLERFRRALEQVRAAAGEIRWIHSANSAAVLSKPDAHFNMVRPGLMLYGVSPSRELAGRASLVPVMRLVTRVARVRRVPAGTPVGYGSTFVTRRESIIATIAAGYADGYLRALSGRASVLLGGQRAPVVGRVCMDHTMVDATDCGEVSVGQEVVLWGGQDGAFIDVSEVARWAETIPYEMLVGVGRRVPRLAV